MVGAMLGDMIGAPYEFDRGDKTKDFPLFIRNSVFTDDSVMTVAVAEALMDTRGGTDDEIRTALVRSMQKWGRKYPNAGYGGRFYYWLRERNPKPYGSYGNGSAMRVSGAGWLGETIGETRRLARLTADVTHNHPEGIKGAEAAASAIFLARTGKSKEEIRTYIESEFGYNLSRTCDQIRPGYRFDVTCQGSVPEAITAFLEGKDLEDTIRTAVSLGGDTDTLGCIAGGMAEAFFGVPAELEAECRKRLPKDMRDVLDRFQKMTGEGAQSDGSLNGNERIEQAIEEYHADSCKEKLVEVLEVIRQRMQEDGRLLYPILPDANDPKRFSCQGIECGDGKKRYAAFTSRAEFRKGPASAVISESINKWIGPNRETDGLIINPWGKAFLLTQELIGMILQADRETE